MKAALQLNLRPAHVALRRMALLLSNPVFSFISGGLIFGFENGFFSRVLPMKKWAWLWAQLNHRHVDFQSNQNAMPNKPADRKLAKGPSSVRSANPARVQLR
jgi:hypothetical protein